MAFRGRIKGFVLEVCGVVVGKEGGWWMKFEYSRSFRGQSSLGKGRGRVVMAVRLRGGYFVR